ncbi:alkaline phosphatase D family protein [Novosphingobium album (ex Hu et al. 2023)]|uniref:Alkaline phosphatase D family protein n=1 Tax=Novosphingobium album (ex Hu et al. 2023) TaxID=2930093 RepID=A0ABT0B1W1_9SPHN|nr:alkaline phosphatase D family protein [Novosphingobium album (ex Hu et al. 2023)]MCJ2178918.1 alkaline phosphatase D family protein [Novosphingobium album (ex Hu et al. 2023)]
MTLSIDRRLLIKAGAFGLAALSTPGAAQILTARGFTHGIASGEPSAHSVLLWTRYVGSGETKLHCEVSLDESFSRIAGGGDVVASPEHDNCAKLVVTGLEPGKWYFYRFVAPDGTKSEVGRTRTLPVGEVSRFGIGLFSCSNMPFGWFNAYAHAAERGDLDLMVHVGDYFYEYRPGHYPETVMPGRMIEPDHDIVTLADYRMRFACYRLDPDLRRLHQQFPMIAQWDDHEFANDDWQNGAENHDPAMQGPWSARRAAAMRAYCEWMPVSDDLYNSFQIGTLATIFRPETRVTGRSEQLSLGNALKDQTDIAKALAAFRDGPWMASERTLMGARQEDWLYKGLAASAKAGTRWQVLAQEIVMGNLRAPAALADLTPADAPASARQQAQVLAAASKMGLPFNMDSWDGYPAARERLLRASREAGCNLVVLSGDSHNAWGNQLSLGSEPVGVEFAGQSVTSSGYETFLPTIAPRNLAALLRETNPGLTFTDTSRRGYVSLQLTPEAVQGTWHFMSTIAARTTVGTRDHTLGVKWGERRFTKA